MSSYIRVLHASPDAPPVDVYVNDSIIARGLSYRNFTEYLPFQPGTYNMKVYQAGSKSIPVIDTSLNIPGNSILTVAAAGRLDNIELLPVSDKPAFINPDKVNIKFANLSPDAPIVDVILSDGTVLFRNVPFRGITEYMTVNPGTYTLQLKAVGSNDVVLTVPNQKFSGGRVYSAYAAGLVKGGPPLQLLTPLDGSSYLKANGNNQNNAILDLKQADVNGDGIIDSVSLIGNKPDPESPFADNITVCVEDGKAGNKICATPPFNAGYNANLFLADFTGDNISDILVRIESGGSGGYLYAYVYSLEDNRLAIIFDSEAFNARSQFDVVFKDNYKVEVTQVNTNKKFTIDLSNRKDDYSDIYDQNGMLTRPVTGSVLGLGGLEPVDVDNDGDYELVAVQRIIGRYNADTLGYVRTTLEWNGAHFVQQNINVVPYITPPLPGSKSTSRSRL